MNVYETNLDGVLEIVPQIFEDHRGHFFESFNECEFNRKCGTRVRFVQDNQSRSIKDVLRGIHYQRMLPQGKLVRVLYGEIFDVAVDLRKSSSTFGGWYGTKLSVLNAKQLWIPEGFGHAFLVLSDFADVAYKTTKYYYPEYEDGIVWNDPTIGITWTIISNPILSNKDERLPQLHEVFRGL